MYMSPIPASQSKPPHQSISWSLQDQGLLPRRVKNEGHGLAAGPVNGHRQAAPACPKSAKGNLLILSTTTATVSSQSTSDTLGALMTILYFEEAEVGKLRTAGPYLVSRNEIIEFARKYDPQPFHIDEEAAARSVFAGLTASGAHTFAILISLLSKTEPYSLRVLAGLGWDELRFLIPVRPGDELYLELAILEKRESKSNSDRGIVRGQIHLRNQKREIVLQCVNTVLVARRPAAKSST
jgi:acyl dehydratase